MNRSVRRLCLPVLALFLAVFAPFASTAVAQSTDSQSPRQSRIVVTGEGDASVKPDMALLSIAVLREAATARAALTANNEAMTAVIAAMKSAGIAERDLRTSGIRIDPRYVYPNQNEPNTPPRIDGYTVTNTLSVRVRELAKAGEILDLSVSLGINQGGGIEFVNDDPSPTIAEARKQAVRDAVDKANTLAEAAGVALGPIVEITEQNFSRPQPQYMAKAVARDAAESVPLEAGENSYSVQVTMVFELAAK